MQQLAQRHLSMHIFIRLFAVFLTGALLQNTGSAQADAQGIPIPITITFRKSLLNDSLVARFTNTSKDKSLTAVVTFKNSTFNEVKSRKLSVGPGSTVEVGWTKGWKFMSGETITVDSLGYDSLSVKVP